MSNQVFYGKSFTGGDFQNVTGESGQIEVILYDEGDCISGGNFILVA